MEICARLYSSTYQPMALQWVNLPARYTFWPTSGFAGSTSLARRSHFLKLYGEKNRKEIKALAPEVMHSFQRYGWPGNIRELENVLERGVILCQSDTLTIRELPQALQGYAYWPGQEEAAEPGWPDLQRELISRTLQKVAGDRRQAGDILGISQDELDSKIRAYGLDY